MCFKETGWVPEMDKDHTEYSMCIDIQVCDGVCFVSVTLREKGKDFEEN